MNCIFQEEHLWTQKLKDLQRTEIGNSGKGIFAGTEAYKGLVTVFEVYLYKRAVLFSEHGLSSKDFGVPHRLMGLVVNYCLMKKAACNGYRITGKTVLTWKFLFIYFPNQHKILITCFDKKGKEDS